MAQIRGGNVRPHVQAAADGMERAGLCRSFGTYPNHQPTIDRAFDAFHTLDDWDAANAIAEFAFRNWHHFGFRYIISMQRINWNDGRGWIRMEDRGGAVQNHREHVHCAFQITGAATPTPPPQPEKPRFDQVFSPSPYPVTRFIRSVANEKVIDISSHGDSAPNAANLSLYPIDGQKDQRWKLIGYPNDETAFVSLASDVAIDRPGGTELWVWQHQGDNRNQRFYLVRLGYNLCQIIHKDSRLTVTAEGDNIALATARQIPGTDSPVPEQVWDFVQSI